MIEGEDRVASLDLIDTEVVDGSLVGRHRVVTGGEPGLEVPVAACRTRPPFSRAQNL